MKVRVTKGPWGYSPRGFDHETAPAGAVLDVPEALALSAIAAGDVESADGPARKPRAAPQRAAAKAAPEQG